MPRSRRLLGVLAAALVLAGLVLGAYLRTRATARAAAENESGTGVEVSAAGADVAIPVEGAPVVRGTLVLSVTASGQAEAERRVAVLAEVEGRVAAVRVRESDFVPAGALLVALDTTESALAVAEAEARLRGAEAQYRELTLFEDRIEDPAVRAERERVARAKSGLDAAAAALARARLSLQRTRIVAPFAGRVASVRVVPGQWVRPGEELLTLLDLDPIRVEVQVLESEVAHLAPGRRARVVFSAFPDSAFAGRIETINPVVERETRTARVVVAVPNPEARILPGMYARVSLEARRFPNRILVPRAAILERDRGRTMLFVYEGDERGGLAKWRYVTTGLENDSLVEVVPNPETEMVRPGEIVLTGGHYTLIHDARVRLVADAQAAGGRPN